MVWATEHQPATAVALVSALHLYAYTRMWDEPFAWAETLAGTAPEPEVLAALATRAAQQGRLDEAAELAERVLADHDRADGDPRITALALEALADVQLYRYRTDEAVATAERLLALGQMLGQPHLVAVGFTNAVLARVYAGRSGETDQVLDTVTLPSGAAPSDQAWMAFTRGEAAALRGRPAAVTELERAVALADSVGNVFISGLARVSLADLAARTSPAAAAPLMHRTIETFLRRGNVTHLTSALRLTVPVLAALGADREAVLVGAWATSPGTRPGHPEGLAEVRRTVQGLRDLHGWSLLRDRGAGLTPAEAAETSLTALHRILTGSSEHPHAPEPAGRLAGWHDDELPS